MSIQNKFSFLGQTFINYGYNGFREIIDVRTNVRIAHYGITSRDAVKSVLSNNLKGVLIFV